MRPDPTAGAAPQLRCFRPLERPQASVGCMDAVWWCQRLSNTLTPAQVQLLGALNGLLFPKFAGRCAPDKPSPGRHCHSTRSLAGIGCHPAGIYTAVLLLLLSVSAKMTVSSLGVFDVFVFGTALPENTRVFHTSSLKKSCRYIQTHRMARRTLTPRAPACAARQLLVLGRVAALHYRSSTSHQTF